MAYRLLPLDLRIDQAISEVALATHRLSLRPLRSEDRALLAGAFRAPAGDLAGPAPDDDALAELCERAQAEWLAAGMGDFLVFRAGEPVPVGLVRLAPVAGSASGRVAELTYQVNPAFRNHGYATEAVAAVLGFAFDEARLDHVIACIEPGNQASLRVAERNGMMGVAEGRVAGRLVRRMLISAAAWQIRRRFTQPGQAPAADASLRP